MKNDHNKNNSQPDPQAPVKETVVNPAVKDPADWTTGNEQMTGAQQSYLQTLAQEAGVEIDPGMTKAEASKKIEELQKMTGRGIDH